MNPRKQLSPNTDSFRRLWVSTSLPIDFHFYRPDTPKRLVILLHGYQQTGASLFKRLKECAGPQDWIIAPNAPFPTPVPSSQGPRLGYSWYFYDDKNQGYWIPMDPATNAVCETVSQLNAWDLPKVIVGFSQGGFLAPFLAKKLPQVQQLIGLGSRPYFEPMGGPADFPSRFLWNHVHGELDDVIPYSQALQEYQEHIQKKWEGEWISLPKTGHEIDSFMQLAVRRLLNN